MFCCCLCTNLTELTILRTLLRRFNHKFLIKFFGQNNIFNELEKFTKIYLVSSKQICQDCYRYFLFQDDYIYIILIVTVSKIIWYLIPKLNLQLILFSSCTNGLQYVLPPIKYEQGTNIPIKLKRYMKKRFETVDSRRCPEINEFCQ